MIPRKLLSCVRVPIDENFGRATESIGDSFTIRASVQPLKPADLLLLPENRRQSKSRKLFTNDVLYCFGDPTYNPDQVTIGDETFEVVAEDVWENGIIPYKMYIVSIVTAAI